MFAFKTLVLVALACLSGCAELVAVLGVAAVEQSAHLRCEQMATMEQRNQCLRSMDQTTPQDMRPRRPPGAGARSPAASPSDEELARRREALCIRREGQQPLCPN